MTLAQIRKHALSLPGTTEEPHFERTSFRVKGKIFVTAKPSETHIHVFVPEQARESTLAMHPDYVSKLIWGAKVVGLRIDLLKAHPNVVRDLVGIAWKAKAPKTEGNAHARSHLQTSPSRLRADASACGRRWASLGGNETSCKSLRA
jgi:hypothetical protein